MISISHNTLIHKQIPKDMFYSHFHVSKSIRNKFISDVESIFMEWKLTEETLHLNKKSHIKEIDGLLLQTYDETCNDKVLETITKLPRKVFLVLGTGAKRQAAIFYRRLYRTPWMDKRLIELEVNGNTLDNIWIHLIEQIALPKEDWGSTSFTILDKRLAYWNHFRDLKKEIERLEKAARKETQPKKKYELYTKMQEYQKQLEDWQNGKA
jgi:hypothetical protein